MPNFTYSPSHLHAGDAMINIQYCNKINCLIINEQRISSWLNRTYSLLNMRLLWLIYSMQSCHWRGIVIVIPPSFLPPSLPRRNLFRDEIWSNFWHGLLCYKFRACEGSWVTPVLRITAPRGIDRVVMLHLDISVTSSVRAWRVAKLTGDYCVKNTQSVGTAIWRWGTGYPSGSPCTSLFMFACFTVLHYGKDLCSFEHDETVITWSPINIESLATSLWESQILKFSHYFKVYSKTCPQTT